MTKPKYEVGHNPYRPTEQKGLQLYNLLMLDNEEYVEYLELRNGSILDSPKIRIRIDSYKTEFKNNLLRKAFIAPPVDLPLHLKKLREKLSHWISVRRHKEVKDFTSYEKNDLLTQLIKIQAIQELVNLQIKAQEERVNLQSAVLPNRLEKLAKPLEKTKGRLRLFNHDGIKRDRISKEEIEILLKEREQSEDNKVVDEPKFYGRRKDS